MKELIILRHAKSNRTFSGEDINRPLSLEGIKKIKKISHQKENFFNKSDVIITSPAIRALHTATIVLRELDLSMEKLKIDNPLYTFSVHSIIDYVYTLDDRWNNVVLVGHNPAFIDVINYFSEAGINHLRTAGFAQITFNADYWKDLYKGDVVLGQKINNI
jgi:phosphohistidine phosphatase